MDKRLTSAGGRTPSPALSAPSPFVPKAGGGSHCKAFGIAVTGVSPVPLHHLQPMQELFRKALGKPKTKHYICIVQKHNKMCNNMSFKLVGREISRFSLLSILHKKPYTYKLTNDN